MYIKLGHFGRRSGTIVGATLGMVRAMVEGAGGDASADWFNLGALVEMRNSRRSGSIGDATPRSAEGGR